jgi:predicted acylesterase/phospholipase RssA
MLTTDLTTGGPLRLPHGIGRVGRGYFFDPREMRRLFPQRVVRWLEEHPPPEPDAAGERERWRAEVAAFAERGLAPMPAPADLPVVVATRMSLSFPFLLSAVPLHSIDRSLQEPAPERVWFSDGGITSNFPVHFFDTPLPVHPTFGINLRPFHVRYPKSAAECDNVFLPRDNRAGILAWWTRWHHERGFGRLAGFGGAILNALQNWSDNAQLPVPGYRDRVVHVSHDDTEGGLNLDMPPAVLAALSERGRCAGEELAHAYTTPPDGERRTSWENHRWVRLRSSLGLVEELLDELERDWTAGEYDALLAAHRDAPSYGMTDKQQGLAGERMEALMELAREWRRDVEADPNRSLRYRAPRPRPAFRIVPSPAPADD